MITTPRKTVLAALAVASLAVAGSSGGGVATADEPPAEVTTYTCDALTSASVPAVKKRLTSQGVDVSDVKGPIGLSCRKTGDGEAVAASVTGVEGVAFRCASAQEKSSTKIVFFVDCDQSTSATG